MAAGQRRGTAASRLALALGLLAVAQVRGPRVAHPPVRDAAPSLRWGGERSAPVAAVVHPGWGSPAEVGSSSAGR